MSPTTKSTGTKTKPENVLAGAKSTHQPAMVDSKSAKQADEPPASSDEDKKSGSLGEDEQESAIEDEEHDEASEAGSKNKDLKRSPAAVKAKRKLDVASDVSAPAGKKAKQSKASSIATNKATPAGVDANNSLALPAGLKKLPAKLLPKPTTATTRDSSKLTNDDRLAILLHVFNAFERVRGDSAGRAQLMRDKFREMADECGHTGDSEWARRAWPVVMRGALGYAVSGKMALPGKSITRAEGLRLFTYCVNRITKAGASARLTWTKLEEERGMSSLPKDSATHGWSKMRDEIISQLRN